MTTDLVSLGNDQAQDILDQRMNLDLACIGNCSYSALLNKKGQVVWSCYPRFDGDPIFCSLLKLSNTYSNDIGFFDVSLANCVKSEQSYLRNTAVLSTKLYEEAGNAIELIDFIPRFESHEREYRPNMFIRIVKPIGGRPRAKIRLRPTFGYGWGTPEKTRGSNHIRYLLSNTTVRLTTNAPISYIVEEVLFEVDEPIYLLLMPDESLKAPINQLSESYLQKTSEWWTNWTRNLSIPFEWQDEVIRAAITLKMGHFEETGAIVAAMTTSIPSSPLGGTWDYRYCWLREATLVVRILNKVGATETMESFLRFLNNVVATFHATKEHRIIHSVYGVSMETRLYEREMHRLPGYRGIGPVRLGNKDSEMMCNDVYGAAVLALSHLFLDRRLIMQGNESLFNKMEELGQEAALIYNQPDFVSSRGRKDSPQLHSYSSVMCWAACDCLAKISARLNLTERSTYWSSKAQLMKEDIMNHIWNEHIQSFTSIWDGNEVDANLILLPGVGFVSYKDAKFLNTLKMIERQLLRNGMILPYPKINVTNNYFTFSYIKCLNEVGRSEEARKLFEKMVSRLNSNGMLSEAIDVETNEWWGNFPQNVAMTGLINCAMCLSKPWE